MCTFFKLKTCWPIVTSSMTQNVFSFFASAKQLNTFSFANQRVKLNPDLNLFFFFKCMCMLEIGKIPSKEQAKRIKKIIVFQIEKKTKKKTHCSSLHALQRRAPHHDDITQADPAKERNNHNSSPSRLNWIVPKTDKSCTAQETFGRSWLLRLRRAVVSEESEEKTNLPRVSTLINYVTIPFIWSYLERRLTTPSISCYYYNIGVKSGCKLHHSAVHNASHFSFS